MDLLLRPEAWLSESERQHRLNAITQDRVYISPAKQGGSCDVMGRTDPLTSLINAAPSTPYEYLYTMSFGTKKQATSEIERLGARLEKKLCARGETNPDNNGKTKRKGGKLAVYGCECIGCSSSLEADGVQPFQLCLRSTTQSGKPMFHFEKTMSQHKHGPYCARERVIKESIGGLPRVQRLVQANPTADNHGLMTSS